MAGGWGGDSPATWAAACDVPLWDVKQVLQSLEAPMMSFPGAKRSTQRPKLVPKVPRVTGWSRTLVAPTVMTWQGEEVGSREKKRVTVGVGRSHLWRS